MPSRRRIDICDTKWQRQTTHISYLSTKIRKMQGGVKEPLPIVELKPFSSQVWRREKSLPDFYTKHTTSNPENIQDVRRSQSESGPNGDILTRDVPLSLNLNPPPRYLETRVGVENNTKIRARHHPTADFSYNCHQHRSSGLIPGFVTRIERTKSTLEDAKKENNPNKTYSCFKQALNPMTLAQQQEIKVRGGRLKSQDGRRPLIYLNPLASYTQTSQWQAAYQSENSTQDHSAPQMSFTLQKRNKPVPYVSHDRDALPSRMLSRGSLRFSNQFRTVKEPEAVVRSKHHIGGIRNSLQILSETGKPTKLERHLTFEMELHLEKCRRHIDFNASELMSSAQPTFLPITPSEISNLSNGLTPGELMLRQGREANKKKRREMARGDPVPRNIPRWGATNLSSGTVTQSIDQINGAFQSVVFHEQPMQQSNLNRSNNGVISPRVQNASNIKADVTVPSEKGLISLNEETIENRLENSLPPIGTNHRESELSGSDTLPPIGTDSRETELQGSESSEEKVSEYVTTNQDSKSLTDTSASTLVEMKNNDTLKSTQTRNVFTEMETDEEAVMRELERVMTDNHSSKETPRTLNGISVRDHTFITSPDKWNFS